MPHHVYNKSSRTYKHSFMESLGNTIQSGLKETTRVRFGVWGRILHDFISRYGPKLIKPIFLVNHVIENGLAKLEDKPKLRRRAFDIFKRFTKHGILERIGRGLYRVVVDPVDVDAIYMDVSTPLLKLPKEKPNPTSKPKLCKGNPDPKLSKGNQGGSPGDSTRGCLKETTTTSNNIPLGSEEWFILYHFHPHNPGEFRPVHVVDYAIKHGFARKEDRPKLLKRVSDTCKRLVKRCILARTRYGFYKVIVRVEDLKAKLVHKEESLIRIHKPKSTTKPKPSVEAKEAHETSPPVSLVGRSGVFLDNVRGVRVDGSYVHGDRGRVICFGDLDRFRSVSYAELSIPSFSRLLEGLGVIVLYFGGKVVECLSNPVLHGRVIESGWFEWRAPSGFYEGRSTFDVERVFRERVGPSGFAEFLFVLDRARVPLAKLAQILWASHRRLYYFVKKRSFTKTPSDRVVMDCIDRCIEGYLSKLSGLPPPPG